MKRLRTLGFVGLVLSSALCRAVDLAVDPIVQRYLGDRHATAGVRPTLVILAGGSGAGKSTIRAELVREQVLMDESFVTVDLDEIRELVPRYAALKKTVGVAEAIEQTKADLGLLSDAIRNAALARGLNIVSDQTLRSPAARTAARDLVRGHPEYLSVLIHVDASVATALARVQRRQTETGRGAPEELVRSSRADAAQSFVELAPEMDLAIEIDNETAPLVKSVARHGEKQLVNKPLAEGIALIARELRVSICGTALMNVIQPPGFVEKR